ncbi:MAG: ABC transporter substrate-binding protein [Natronospirillum sp.]|uniref:ABC transporter substrate-binding protein n=1 Tax=Natronospirillum sp. TaxID=2812955 RepID=UPI0025E01D55|nr:ABC transporter substrate-binding protein [Natronospirillum sp.]MCH8551970.1 ABC transporter substrate-binding protein [Natronospirillum sp.]
MRLQSGLLKASVILSMFIFVNQAKASGPVLPIALINDSEAVFDDYSQERNLGFRLGLEYGTRGELEKRGVRLEVNEYTLPTELWEANQLPDADQLPDAPVWIAPVQARKAHRIIQYGDYLEHLTLVPATAANSLPVADSTLAFRTFYRWQDIEVALADWTDGQSRIWVSAVDSDIELPVTVRRVDVSPRSAGAGVVESVSGELAANNGGRLTNSWPVLLDWLDVLQQEAGFQPEQLTTWLPDLAGLVALHDFPGAYGVTYYYYDLPDNEINDWLVRAMLERHDRLPSHYVVAGMNSALALLEALEQLPAEVEPSAAVLAEQMATLSWQGPQGEMQFVADGETRQPLFRTRLRQQPQLEWARPILVQGGVIYTHQD